MKKIAMIVVALAVALGAKAQFEEGKFYVGASLTSLNLSYSGSEKFHLGLNAEGGYFFMDNLMLMGHLGVDQYGSENDYDSYTLGAGLRYYIIQNGIYLGVNAKYKHIGKGVDDLVPGIEVGYAYFLNRHITVEPAIYYDQSFKSHSDYSKFGAKVGIGVYLFKK